MKNMKKDFDLKLDNIGFVGTHNHDEFKDFKKCYEIYKVVKRIKGALNER